MNGFCLKKIEQKKRKWNKILLRIGGLLVWSTSLSILWKTDEPWASTRRCARSLLPSIQISTSKKSVNWPKFLNSIEWKNFLLMEAIAAISDILMNDSNSERKTLNRKLNVFETMAASTIVQLNVNTMLEVLLLLEFMSVIHACYTFSLCWWW